MLNLDFNGVNVPQFVAEVEGYETHTSLVEGCLHVAAQFKDVPEVPMTGG